MVTQDLQAPDQFALVCSPVGSRTSQSQKNVVVRRWISGRMKAARSSLLPHFQKFAGLVAVSVCSPAHLRTSVGQHLNQKLPDQVPY